MPAWDEITPSTERSGTVARRLTATNVLIGLNAVGFVVAVLSDAFKFHALRDAAQFSFESAVGKGWIWQFLTYTFLHPIQPLPNLLPMLVAGYLLFERGSELERDLGWRRFLALYFGASIYGAVMHAAVQATFGWGPEGIVPATDFYGPVIAVVLVHAMRAPERTSLFLLIFPLKALTSAVLTSAVFLLYGAFVFKAGVFSLAGGAIFAFAMTAIEPRVDAWLDAAATRRERARFLQEVEIRREVDRILDKISREGMDSLSSQERHLLKQASRLTPEHREKPHE